MARPKKKEWLVINETHFLADSIQAYQHVYLPEGNRSFVRVVVLGGHVDIYPTDALHTPEIMAALDCAVQK